ncbi:MAG: tRNA pseudouridine synthase B, partial [Actinomycetes bacterium]
LTLTDKAYTATLRLGVATITDDAEGEVTARPGAAAVSEAEVRSRLPEFRGDLKQVPSAVSAIKVAGVRSYARVRAGEAVALKPRPVHVSRFACTAVRPGEADGVPVLDCDVEVVCSSGTYVRALARDLGAVLGTGGHLTALRRTRVGPFTLAEAQTLEQAAADLALVDLADVARRCFAVRMLTEDQAAHVRHGRALTDLDVPADPTALLSPVGEFLALYRPYDVGSRPVAVFAPAHG